MALLVTLVSGGQRSQTIHALKLKHIIFLDKKVVIPIMEKIKQTTAGKYTTPLKYNYYLMEPKLCVLTHLNIYLNKTKGGLQNCL